MIINNINYRFIVILSIVLFIFSQTANAQKQSDSEVVEKVIMSRRSIRQYKDTEINKDILDQILKCGINAPNGQGRQAYEIRVVNNPKILKEITEAVLKDNTNMSLRQGANNIFAGAPCVIFLANDTSYDMSQVDCGLLGENIILSAWAKGIGTCCMAHPIRLMKSSESCAPFIEKLGFSEGYDLLYCIVMGYPNETPNAKPRKEDMIKYIE